MSETILAKISAILPLPKLADELGIRPQAIYQWKRIPVGRVLQIERLTGISRHEQRPDIYPKEAA
jgi:DNA-binding transcriptional regulator YdaS (Cro superfamily)